MKTQKKALTFHLLGAVIALALLGSGNANADTNCKQNCAEQNRRCQDESKNTNKDVGHCIEQQRVCINKC